MLYVKLVPGDKFILLPTPTDNQDNVALFMRTEAGNVAIKNGAVTGKIHPDTKVIRVHC